MELTFFSGSLIVAIEHWDWRRCDWKQIRSRVLLELVENLGLQE